MQELARWLLDAGRRCSTIEELLRELGPRLRARVPVDRLWVGTKVLHPQSAAWYWVWTASEPVVFRQLDHASIERLAQGDTPIRRLELGADSVRIRRSAATGAPSVSDLGDLWAQGYTDFLALPLHFRGEWVGGFTFASRHELGFGDEEITQLFEIVPVLSAVLQPLAQDLVTASLLRTYLGRDAGERVFRGQVRRGQGQTLRAVVWFSDVRGFTRLSNELSAPDLLGLLDDHFELMVSVVEEHGGEVLKFLGDGLLAVFAATGDGSQACGSARRAALALQDRLAATAERRLEWGQKLAAIDVGLHFGSVHYGSIGAPHRLDFTVIGQAVNAAARIEGLCGTLGEPVLASEEFVRREGGAWDLRGVHDLKGLPGLRVYRPARFS
jgi:adenylate cyclase